MKEWEYNRNYKRFIHVGVARLVSLPAAAGFAKESVRPACVRIPSTQVIL